MRRLVLVGDDSLIVQALVLGLRKSGEFAVVGQHPPAVAAEEVIAAAPEVVVVDDPEGRHDVTPLIRQIKAQRPAAAVIMLTLAPHSAGIQAAFAAGAAGAVSKSASPAALSTVVRETIDGRFLNLARNAPAGGAEGWSGGAAPALLSTRELEVLRLLAAGSTNRQIAQRLWVTEQTVKFHLSNIYRKLSVGNRTEAAHYAHVSGLLAGGGPATEA